MFFLMCKNHRIGDYPQLEGTHKDQIQNMKIKQIAEFPLTSVKPGYKCGCLLLVWLHTV